MSAPVLTPPRPDPSAASTSMLRNGYALILNTGLTAVLGLAYWVLAARLYPPAALGAGAAAVSAVLLLAGISQLNLMGALTRFLPVSGRHAPRLVLGAYGAATLTSAVVGTVAVATAGWWSSPGSPLRSGLGFRIAFVGAVVAWALFVLQDATLTGLRRASWVPVENAAFGVVKLAMLVALSASATGAAVFASWTVPAALALVPVNVLIYRRLIPEHLAEIPRGELPPRRALLRFVGGDYAGSLFGQALLAGMPLLVVAVLGEEDGAHFYIPWVIATTIDLVASNLAAALTVEGARNSADLGHLTDTVLRRLAAVLLPAVVVVVVAAPFVLSAFGDTYRSGSGLALRLLALATLPKALATVFIALSRVERQVRPIVATQAAQAVLILGAAAAALPRVGIAGAAVAVLAGHTVVALATASAVRRRVVSP